MKSRKPTLSPTKMLTYLACRMKYYWAYLNPMGRYFQRARAEFTFGTTLHRVLQHFHEQGGAEQVEREQLFVTYEQTWSDAGFEHAEHAEEHKELGRELLNAYYEQQMAQPGEAKVLLTEKMLRKDMGRFVLIGRLDRVDEYPDGTLEIIDYKSGRSTVTYEQVYDDFAMGCYQLLVREHYPDRPVVATIIALRSGDKATAFLAPDELKEFEAAVRELGEEILDKDIETYHPKRIDLCETCEFLKLCQRQPEFEN